MPTTNPKHNLSPDHAAVPVTGQARRLTSEHQDAGANHYSGTQRHVTGEGQAPGYVFESSVLRTRVLGSRGVVVRWPMARSGPSGFGGRDLPPASQEDTASTARSVL